MIAVCIAEAESARARGRSAAFTTPGSSAETVGLSNVRAAPRTMMAAKTAGVESQPS